MSDVIKINNISKLYHLYNEPIDRLKEALHPMRKKYHHDFYALKDINFEVKRGETIGLIGKNGSGKSTLLKILTGVLTPSSGNYYVHGKISSLLELGAGFNPELSGLENVYFNGTILGRTRKEMDNQLDDILAFADIGEFIHQPVKTYSSGMAVRLAFAVAVNVDPDVLIIDEALAVGDMTFQKKCMEKINDFKESGKTIVFCSHDMHAVGQLCDRAIWIKEGEIADIGKSEEVISSYVSWMTSESLQSNKPNLPAQNKNPNYYVRNSEIVDILSIRLFDKLGRSKSVFFEGDYMNIEFEFQAKEDLIKPHFHFAVFRSDKVLTCLHSTTFDKNLIRKSYKKGEIKINMSFKIQLCRGHYIIGLSVWDSAKKISFANNITREFEVKTLKVVFGPISEKCVFFPDLEWKL